MKQENYYDILTRYLDGTASQNEAGLLLNWVKSDKQHMDLFIEMKDLWAKTGLLNKNDLETNLALQRFKNRLAKNHPSTTWQKELFVKYKNIAAILLIALLSGALLFSLLSKRIEKAQVVYTETIIPDGQKGKMILADGTKISLNSGTRIRYPSNFNGNTREVYLEGEGYFEVAHNKAKPFLVHSGRLTVKVLGTSFNMKSYPDENRIETTLITGSIKLFETKGKQNNEITTLKPNEQAVYDKVNGEMSIKQFHSVSTEIAPAVLSKRSDSGSSSTETLNPQVESIIQWKDQKLIFKDETFKEMAEKLTRWYGKKIHIESESLKNNRYSGKFIYNETIYQVLEVIRYTTDLSYYEKDHEIYIKTK